ncbi:MAG: hypothetical protein ACI4SG_01455 [Oligosphaeraceae bacterium]
MSPLLLMAEDHQPIPVSPGEYQRVLVEYQQEAAQLSTLQWQHEAREQERRREVQAAEGELRRGREEKEELLRRKAALAQEKGEWEAQCRREEESLGRLAPAGLPALQEEGRALAAQEAQSRALTFSREFLVGPDGRQREFQVLYLGTSRCWMANFAAQMGGYGIWNEAAGLWEHHWDAALLPSLREIFSREGGKPAGTWEMPL